MSELPAWLTERPAPPQARRRRRFSEAVGRATRRTLLSLGDALARQAGSREAERGLAAVDARAKILGAGALVAAVTILHRPETLAAAVCLGLALLLAAGARGRRVLPAWVGVLLFTVPIALPATLNLVTPGAPSLVLWRHLPARLGPWHTPGLLAVTDAGVLVAARLVLRALACVSLALLPAATTQPWALIRGLRLLGMPKGFGMVLAMTQRYLVVLLRAAEELHLAKLSRTFGTESVREGQDWASKGIGQLLVTSLRLADETHQAMLSRGYQGEVTVISPPRWGWAETAVVAVALAAAAALIICDRML